MDRLLPSLVVATAQPMVKLGEVDANIRSHLEMIERAADQGAQLIITSESALNGYDKRGVGVATALLIDDPRLDAFSHAAARLGVCPVIGVFVRQSGVLYNSVIAFLPDGSRVVQHKHVLTPMEMEFGITVGPATRTPLLFEGRKIALVICADVAIRDLWPTLAREGFDTFALSTAGLGDISAAVPAKDVRNLRKIPNYVRKSAEISYPKLVLRVCLQHQLNGVAINQAGYEPEKRFFHVGHGCVVSRDGRIHGIIPGQFIGENLRPELLVCTLPEQTVANPSGAKSPADVAHVVGR